MHNPTFRYMRVRPLLLAVSLAVATLANAPAFAQTQATPAAALITAHVVPAARDAVVVADTFSAALSSGQLDTARQLMTPDAVVVANGQVLGERDAYIDGAAKGDAAALRGVQRELLRREAGAGSDVAWVLSEKRVRAAAQGGSEVVMESMLLIKTPSGWKITQIHWSGRHG
jgi:ketosteroid isomerase-like protein